MKEQLISFETAKLAKEKQFQERTPYFYTIENGLCSIDTDGEILNTYNDDLTFKNSIWDCNGDFWYNEIEDEEGIYAQTYEPIKYPASTQSLLQKWLREKYDLDPIVCPNILEITKEIFYTYAVFDLKNISADLPDENNCMFKTYEEALEEGLQKALKLI